VHSLIWGQSFLDREIDNAYVCAVGPIFLRTVQMRAAHTRITSCPRRGLSRLESALYWGISPTKFDQLRKEGRVPSPRLIDGRKVWDVRELDLAFEEFPLESNDNSEGWTAVV
jgi:hypothetical protein